MFVYQFLWFYHQLKYQCSKAPTYSVVGCRPNYSRGPKKSAFYFSSNEDLRNRWIRFINRSKWTPSKHSVICVARFKDKFVHFHHKYHLKVGIESNTIILRYRLDYYSVSSIQGKENNNRNLGCTKFLQLKTKNATLIIRASLEHHVTRHVTPGDVVVGPIVGNVI